MTAVAVERESKIHMREPVGSLTFERSSLHQIGGRIHELMMSRVWSITSRTPSFQTIQNHNEVIYLRSIYRRKESAILKGRMKGGAR